MVFERFIVDHILKNVPGRLEIVPGPIEGILALRLSLFVVQTFEIGVLQALLDSVSFFRVEDQQLAEQVEGHWVCLGIETCPALPVAFGQLADVLAGKIVADESHVFACRSADHSDRALDLVQIVISREERRPAEQLRKDTPNGPDIKSIRVMRRIENDLWCSVPSGDHVFRERGCGLLVAAREAEVANLEIATLVEQQIRRL